MCGICGFSWDDKGILGDMMSLLVHRGPDESGSYVDDNISLGHRRLSILDLKTGRQPIYNEDESVVVVYAGEIYNFLELKEKLISKGHRFYTKTDTEILVHLYEEYGEGLVDFLNGMFTFAIWDKNQKRLLLGRDRVGIKPLFYTLTKEGDIIFSSEIKPLLLHIPEIKLNHNALFQLLNMRFIPSSETLFEGIYPLPPSSILSFKGKNTYIKNYWDLHITEENRSEDYFVKLILKTVEDSVRRHLISDVPVGVFLSGGLDSSSIVAFASKVSDKPIKTFTVGFGESSDELADAKEVSEKFNTEHHEIFLEKDYSSVLPKLIWHIEVPRLNILQNSLVSEFASKYVKVALTGDGGDEIFAGYEIHEYVYFANMFSKIFRIPNAIPEFITPRLNKLHKQGSPEIFEYMRRINFALSVNHGLFNYLTVRNGLIIEPDDRFFFAASHIKNHRPESIQKFYENFFNKEELSYPNKVLYTEFKTKFVNSFLLSSDRMSMIHSLEARTPMLDLEVIENAFRIPFNMKVKYGRTKYLLRKSMKGILPDSIINKKKWGFAYNPNTLLNVNLKEHADNILSKENIDRVGILEYNTIKKILDHKPTNKMRWHYFFTLMALFFVIWHKTFIEGDFREYRPRIEDYY